MNRLDNVGFQFIVGGESAERVLRQAEAFLQGGGRWIQLRLKEHPQEEVCRVAQQLRPLTNRYGAVLIIDDDPVIAQQIGADGVHLGKTDMDTHSARRILGPQAIIGRTANTVEDVRQLCAEPIDYIGLGPFRWTSTKKNLSPLLGLEGYELLLRTLLKEPLAHKPIVAIGGIVLDDLTALGTLAPLGLSGVALSGVIARSTDPCETTRQLKNKMNKCFRKKP